MLLHNAGKYANTMCCCIAGVKALDILTPLGRGASLLVIGPNGSGKTTLALDAIKGCQKGAPMRCVLASTTQTAEQLEQRLKVCLLASLLIAHDCCCSYITAKVPCLQ